MNTIQHSAPDAWASRWSRYARASRLRADEPVVVALSGGADSVLLLHLVAAAGPRPPVLALHVDHGLRGAESDGDAAFCRELCARLGVPLEVRRAEPSADEPNLEAALRRARYALLEDAARRAGAAAILTGHHADDALETLVMRWTRGGALGSCAGLRREREPGFGPVGSAPTPHGRRASRSGSRPDAPGAVRVVRPLIHLRRAEIRQALREHGIAWRDDSSNAAPDPTRNRVRRVLLPALCEAAGPEALDGLHAFARAVEAFEDELAASTAHLVWAPRVRALAGATPRALRDGGTLSRAALAALPRPLRRRALWRLLAEGTGRAAGRRQLGAVLDDLEHGRATRHTLPGGWTLELRADELRLLPPAERVEAADAPGTRRALAVPGRLALPDGRLLHAERVELPPGADVPRSPWQVELDAHALPAELEVGAPRPGQRLTPFGGRGSKRLVRLLADAGIPREERANVPLVYAGDELLWVAGLRPVEGRRVTATTRTRLRLTLVPAASGTP